jgi:hypothetical protein
MTTHKDQITEASLEKALAFVSKEDIANALFNITDVRDALRAKELNRQIDADNESTIGELLEDVISFLSHLEDNYSE